MKSKLKRRSSKEGLCIGLSLLALSIIFGCRPSPERVVIEPIQGARPTPVLPVEVIDGKIAYINAVLTQKNLDEGDKKVALDLLDAYKAIRIASQFGGSDYEQRRVTQLLYDQLSQLDQKYFSKRRPEKPQHSNVISLFAQKKRKILDAYLAGDHKGVVNDCIELEASFGPDALTPEIGLLFALSLAKKGVLKEAVEIGEKIIHETERRPNLTGLRANIVQWQMALGNRDKAVRAYDKLTDNMDEMNALFIQAQQKIVEKDRAMMPPQGSLPTPSSSPQPALQDSLKDSDPMGKLLKEVDGLIQKHAFDGARLLLIRHRLRTQEGPDMETIEQALKSVELAEERFKADEYTQLSQNEETIKLAKKLIEEENFKEALTTLDEIKGAGDVTSEMKQLRELAIEKIINRERNEAAKLFLLAGKTNEPSKKKELLLSSYKILKTLIEKYPLSPLINKLNDHQKKVKEELGRLGVDPE
ncbi:MAG: hypothetical protein ABII26_11620 [Pseudomonadota bacterium]